MAFNAGGFGSGEMHLSRYARNENQANPQGHGNQSNESTQDVQADPRNTADVQYNRPEPLWVPNSEIRNVPTAVEHYGEFSYYSGPSQMPYQNYYAPPASTQQHLSPNLQTFSRSLPQSHTLHTLPQHRPLNYSVTGQYTPVGSMAETPQVHQSPNAIPQAQYLENSTHNQSSQGPDHRQNSHNPRPMPYYSRHGNNSRGGLGRNNHTNQRSPPQAHAVHSSNTQPNFGQNRVQGHS
ncbi:hypothetical protein N431DRAFT_456456 [Stipitochalara longipes BDJ]|nr:hypothetical protein N431DRAFT_456456 [Stipitochalara longipes BDJ]